MTRFHIPIGSDVELKELIDQEAGGGTVRVLGPFSLDYTDFPVDDTEITLFTPNAGDVILKGFGDVATGVSFDDSGSIDFAIGETPDFNDPDAGGFWGFLGNGLGVGSGFPDSDNTNNALLANRVTGAFVSTGAPLKIRAQSVAGDGAAGHMDIYFVVATPTAP
jgi:hypothetical protein